MIAASLGILTPAAARGIDLGDPLAAAQPCHLALTTAGATIAANVASNLPALLLALAGAPGEVTDGVWAALLGLNVGPALLVTGSLSGLLWLDATRRLDVPVTALDDSRVGVAVGVPALVAATAALVVTLSIV